MGAVTSVTPAKIRRLRRVVIVETDWVRISSASTDIDDTGRGVYEQHSDDQRRLLFVVEDLRLSTVYEFRFRVKFCSTCCATRLLLRQRYQISFRHCS